MSHTRLTSNEFIDIYNRPSTGTRLGDFQRFEQHFPETIRIGHFLDTWEEPCYMAYQDGKINAKFLGRVRKAFERLRPVQHYLRAPSEFDSEARKQVELFLFRITLIRLAIRARRLHLTRQTNRPRRSLLRRPTRPVAPDFGPLGNPPLPQPPQLNISGSITMDDG